MLLTPWRRSHSMSLFADRRRCRPTCCQEVSFVSLDSKVTLVGTVSPNRRPSSAASELAKKIESFCQDNYAELAKGR